MTTHQIGKHKIVIYDSIEDLPVKRFHLFNKHLIISSGVGDSIEDIASHIVRAKKFIDINEFDSAKTELDNMLLCFNLSLKGVDLTSRAFCYLIYSIDGKVVDDISEVSIDELQSKVASWSRSFIGNLIEAAKKKMEEELVMFFPERFDASGKEKEYYGLIKSRTLLVLNELVNRKNEGERIKGVENRLLKLSKPTRFLGKNNFEVRYTKNFEKSCLLVGKYYQTDVEKISTLKYFQALEILEKNGK